MKIGVFDSGLGGLVIARALRESLPQYDYLYYGDTLHVPYGRRSAAAIYALVENAVEDMFARGCALAILACNTASAVALRRLQQEWLPARDPARRVLGVVVPTLEAAAEHGGKRIGLLATEALVDSMVYKEELSKIDPAITLVAQKAPLLVPLMENGGEKYIDDALAGYVAPMTEQGIDSLILGCTHYCLLKQKARRMVAPGADVLSQDEIIPPKLAAYLARHPEMDARLSKQGTMEFLVTDLTAGIRQNAALLFGENVALGAAGDAPAAR